MKKFYIYNIPVLSTHKDINQPQVRALVKTNSIPQSRISEQAMIRYLFNIRRRNREALHKRRTCKIQSDTGSEAVDSNEVADEKWAWVSSQFIGHPSGI